MCWNPKYVLLLLASTVVTYVSGLLLKHYREKIAAKKAIVAGCLAANFSILFLFKYFEFVCDTLQKVLGKVGIAITTPSLGLLLPVGISFYIFQAVSYTIDVYREDIEPERNFFRYALFVSFFPQLVAGPIERSRNLLPQLQKMHQIDLWDSKRIQRGFLIILYGYMMKIVLADRAVLIVDNVFHAERYGNYAGFTVLLAMVLFSLQIYCDFAGYTYIAIGAALVMGITLNDNFKTPYLATSIKDFWDRWHLSLTTWFRDYLYIPLGGSRKGKLRKYINIMIVFTVSGLWHGAAWHYVLWGFLHGIMRVWGEMTQKIRDLFWKKCRVNTEVFSFRLGRMLITFILVTIAWVFFRAESIRQGMELIVNGFTTWNPWVLFDGSLLELGLDAKDMNVFLVAGLIMLVVDLCQYAKVDLLLLFEKQNLVFRWIFFYAAIIALVIFGMYGADYAAEQFIYFQF